MSDARPPDTGLLTPLEFMPTRHRLQLAMAVLMLALTGSVLVSLDDMLGGVALPWRLLAMAALALPMGWLLRQMVRHALSRAPVLRMDYQGVSGAALQPPIPWNQLEDAVLERGLAGTATLRLVRRPDADHPDRTHFWSGRNPAQPRISLQLLGPAQQDEAYYALHARLAVLGALAGSGEAQSLRASRHEEAFEEQLDALTPRTWAPHAIVAANVLVWAMNVAAGLSPTRPMSPELFAWGANSAAAVVLDGQWWRLLSAAFLHAGIVHLAFNMFGLWEAGRQLARLLGNGQYLLVYLASALCGSVASLHYAAQKSVSVGASGAVFGVLGALLTASWHYRHQVPAQNRRRLWTGLGIFVTYSLLHGFSQQGVDNAAHVGGLLCGALLGLVLLAPFDTAAPARRRRGLAALAAAGTAAVVGWGVLSTPLPLAWHHQVYAAQERLPESARRFDDAFRQLAADARRLQRGELALPAYLRGARQHVLPACGAIAQELGPLRVPRWDSIGQVVQLYLRICDTASASLRLDLAIAERRPGLPPDAAAQQAQLNRTLDALLRQLGETARRLPTLPAHPGRPASLPPAPDAPRSR